jgi:hypothetical protein
MQRLAPSARPEDPPLHWPSPGLATNIVEAGQSRIWPTFVIDHTAFCLQSRSLVDLPFSNGNNYDRKNGRVACVVERLPCMRYAETGAVCQTRRPAPTLPLPGLVDLLFKNENIMIE